MVVVGGTGQRGLAGNLACLPKSVGSSLSPKPSKFWVPRAPEKTLAGRMGDNSSRRWKLGGHWRAQCMRFLGRSQPLYCSMDDGRNIPGDRQNCLLLSPPWMPSQTAAALTLWAFQGPGGPTLGLRTANLEWHSSRNPSAGEKTFPFFYPFLCPVGCDTNTLSGTQAAILGHEVKAKY